MQAPQWYGYSQATLRPHTSGICAAHSLPVNSAVQGLRNKIDIGDICPAKPPPPLPSDTPLPHTAHPQQLLACEMLLFSWSSWRLRCCSLEPWVLPVTPALSL